MKFVLLVEGVTEKKCIPNLIKHWLDPHLQQRVGIHVVKHSGWQEMVKDAPLRANKHLEDEDVIAVIGLLDLYGPTLYPNHLTDVNNRFQWFKEEMEKRVNHSRFKQYFAVHETESWLLADPTIFPTAIQKSFPGKIAHPETVNFDEPPAKLLNRLYNAKTKSNFKKTIDGYHLFKQLDPDLVYAKCPYFKVMMDEMLQMALKAGL